MLRRTLVLLDETPSSVSARQYAFLLAQCTGTGLVGMSGIDLTQIETPMPGGVGTAAYKAWLEHQLEAQAATTCRRLQEVFELECCANNVPFEWLSFKGDPMGALHLAAETCDLIITGHDTGFAGKVHERISDILAKLLLITPRPVIVCPDVLSTSANILVAYDGSIPAMRALQIFALLEIGKGQCISVTSIDENQERAERRAAGAASYLCSHGYEVNANPIASHVHPADVLTIEISDLKIGTAVMGAYGHRGWRNVLFGSTTKKLIENPPCALFLYH